MQTPFQSRPPMGARTISVKLSNGSGDEVAWLADGGHLCGFSLRAKFDTIEQATQAADEAEKRHNLFADVCAR
jgi:hypothetical protein